MRGLGFGWQAATRTVVWLTVGALLILSYPFVLWWNAERLPPLFPPQLESLDYRVWGHGAEVLLLNRYRAFHQGIVDLRTQWRHEQSCWYPTDDTQKLQTTYQHLLQEGTVLLEASKEKKFTQHQQLTNALESERRQVNRLRPLLGSFDLRRNLRALSVTEGLLNQVASRLQQARHEQAKILLNQAKHSLFPVESQAMAQMERYGATAQLAKWDHWVTNTLDWSSTTGGTAIVVLKVPRQLLLYQHGKPVRRFSIELGFSGL